MSKRNNSNQPKAGATSKARGQRQRPVPRKQNVQSKRGTNSYARGASYRMVGKDLVQSLPPTVTQNNGYFGLITANPAYWSGTRISAISSAYQSYTINRFTVEYVPQVSVGYNGTVIMGTKWDNGVSTPMQQQSLYTSPGGRMTAVYKATRTAVPLSGLQLKRFNVAGDLNTTTNPFIFMAAVRGGFLAYQEPGTTPVTPGYFVVHYDYTFFNPIGSGWSYNTQYAVTLNDVNEQASTTVMLAEDVKPYSAGTYFDYTGGNLSWQNTPIYVPSTTLINVYANGPIANEDLPSDTAVTGQQQLRIVDKIQFRNGVSEEWHDCVVYQVGAGTYQGVPGYSSAYFGLREWGVGDSDREFNLTVWHGIKQIRLSSPIGYYTQMPDPSRTGEFRVGTKIGRHSSICPVNGWNIIDVLQGQALDVPNTLVYPCTNAVFENPKKEEEMETDGIPDNAPQDYELVINNGEEVASRRILIKNTKEGETVTTETVDKWNGVSTEMVMDYVLEPRQQYILIAKCWPTPDVPYHVVNTRDARLEMTPAQIKQWWLIHNPYIVYSETEELHKYSLPDVSGRVTLFGRPDQGKLKLYAKGVWMTAPLLYYLKTVQLHVSPTNSYVLMRTENTQDNPMSKEARVRYEGENWVYETSIVAYLDGLIVSTDPQYFQE